jgi:endonuclease-3
MIANPARDRLIEHGEKLFHAPREFVSFSKIRQADELLNDLSSHPHAFVLACVMDRQIKAEKAWLIPQKIRERLGDFSMQTLGSLSQEQVRDIFMSGPEALHRFGETMSLLFFKGVRRIADRYGSDASRMWAERPASATLVYRFLEFDGIGPKIATMAANILARHFKVPLADHYSIDVSADVHVRRVFERLNFCPSDPSVDQVIYKARELSPTFPGILDLPCWEIGRQWCKPNQPLCSECYMVQVCPTASAASS